MSLDPDGIRWNADRTLYYDGAEWVRASTPTTSATTTPTTTNSTASQTQQPGTPQRTPPPQTSDLTGTEIPLDSHPPSELGATMANLFEQSSAAPYQQLEPPNGLFGQNKQTPGLPATPTIHLDPEFRAAGARDPFIQNFVIAHDKMSQGQVP